MKKPDHVSKNKQRNQIMCVIENEKSNKKQIRCLTESGKARFSLKVEKTIADNTFMNYPFPGK